MTYMSTTSARKILILAANPTDSSRLRLDEEFREIDEGLKRSPNRDKFELTAKWAVTWRDFYRHILEIKPYIVHFSGHGAGEDGIVLEEDDGKAQLVPTDALGNLLKLFSDKGVECVLLNACFSEVQAEAINQHIRYVIGMSKEIGDKAAIFFAVAFYDALGSGNDIEFAFDLACTVARIPEHLTPVLKKNPKVGNQNLSSVNSKLMSNPREKERLEKRIGSIEDLLNVLDEKIASLEAAEMNAANGTTFHIEQELKKCRQKKQELETEKNDLIAILKN